MSGNADAAEGWRRKAESDFAVAELCIKSNTGLDAACFHSQQAAEKSIKAWLVAFDIAFPWTHDLRELIASCATREKAFMELLGDAATLTPFAVTMRYDDDIWPSIEEAREALEHARRIYQFVRDHWK